MLLRHTNKEIIDRKALTVNPAKTCQPIGAMYAALGIKGCLPHSHGSQGCCSYHRSALTRHYKEPVIAGTSSFTEGASVFGGQSNLLQAFTNLFNVYDAEVVAVHSTCLSETIGDDLTQIVTKARKDGKIPEGKEVVYASTPSYAGSHVTGYSNMVKAMVQQLTVKSGEGNNKINIIPSWIEPSDMLGIKKLVSMAGIDFIMYPDTSGVMDAPQTGAKNNLEKGGTSVKDIKSSGDSFASIGLGPYGAGAAARELDRKHKIPCEVLDLPIGVKATDRFITALKDLAGISIPDSITRERGQLVDVITDMQQYFYGKKFAIFGDPDQIVPLTEFLIDLDMEPVVIVSGTPNDRTANWEKRMKEVLKNSKRPDAIAKVSDMFYMHQVLKNEKVDILIGNTYGKYIAKDDDIPFMRYGFPILDRVGHSYFPTVGYKGGIRLLEKILNLLMDRQDRDSTEESFELVM